MAQFDVYRVRGGERVLDCQSDLLANLPSRFVIPLRPPGTVTPGRLTPVFVVEGQVMMLLTPLARGIDLRDIDTTITSLVAHEYAIKAALDMLVSGY